MKIRQCFRELWRKTSGMFFETQCSSSSSTAITVADAATSVSSAANIVFQNKFTHLIFLWLLGQISTNFKNIW